MELKVYLRSISVLEQAVFSESALAVQENTVRGLLKTKCNELWNYMGDSACGINNSLCGL